MAEHFVRHIGINDPAHRSSALTGFITLHDLMNIDFEGPANGIEIPDVTAIRNATGHTVRAHACHPQRHDLHWVPQS